MKKRRRLTVSLDAETVGRIRALAASRGTSMSEMVTGLVEEFIQREQTYEAARRSALEHLERGYPLGGCITTTRDVSHERWLLNR